jgi:hypothetical protein
LIFGGTNDNSIYGLTVDGNYVYATGFTTSQGDNDGLLIKINTGDMSVADHVIYGQTGGVKEVFQKSAFDASSIYVTGGLSNSGTSILLKFDKSDLSLLANTTFGERDDGLRWVAADENYVYAAGRGNSNIQIVKYNKSDLSVVAKKKIGDNESIDGLYFNNGYIYVFGFTTAGVITAYDSIVLKINSSDLSLVANAVYGITVGDAISPFGLFVDGTEVYFSAVDSTASVMVRLNGFPSGAHNSDPARYTLTTMSLSEEDSSYVPSTYSAPVSSPAMVSAVSALTASDFDIPGTPYIISF